MTIHIIDPVSFTWAQLFSCMTQEMRDDMAIDTFDDDDEQLDAMRSFFDWVPTYSAHLPVFISTDDTGVTFNPLHLDVIRAYATIVYHEYEYPDGPNPRLLWTLLGLSSDDDVDYCGSHVEIAIDLLRLAYQPAAA